MFDSIHHDYCPVNFLKERDLGMARLKERVQRGMNMREYQKL